MGQSDNGSSQAVLKERPNSQANVALHFIWNNILPMVIE